MERDPSSVNNDLQAHGQLIEELRGRSRNLEDRINELIEVVTTVRNQSQQTGQIDNIIRNSNFRHSWDTWANETPVPGDQQQELAHVFTHPPDTSRRVYSGSIDVDANASILTIIPDGDDQFLDPSDVGVEIVIDGAGSAGQPLVTTIASVSSASTVVLASAAIVSVEEARVRWRLNTLPRTATKTGTSPINASIKSPGHSGFSSNITDPSWNLPHGYLELGGKNSIDFPLGYWNRGSNVWVSHNLAIPSKVYYFICRIAKKNSTIVPRGFLKAQIWDGSPGKRQVAEGGRFTLAATAIGVPSSVVSSSYKVIARTDRGEVFESNTVTLNRPASGSFVTDTIFTLLTWGSIPGVRRFEVWRKTGTDFERLTTITNGSTQYRDQNVVRETAAGFPLSDRQRPIAETASRPNDLANLITDGFGDWFNVLLPISVPSTYLTGNTFEQWLRVLLTEPCDREMIDVVTVASSASISSLSATFDAADVGLTVRLTNGVTEIETTIASVTDESNAVLADIVPFTSANATIRIVEGGRNGILLAEFGLSLNLGGWAANHDDLATAQGPASNPDGSTIGTGVILDPPIGGIEDPYGGLGGGPNYFPIV